MPQFILRDGEIPLTHLDDFERAGIRLVRDKKYEFDIPMLADFKSDSQIDDFCQTSISKYIHEAQKDALRILTKFGVPKFETIPLIIKDRPENQHLRNLACGIIPIEIEENGIIPAGVYAAARVLEELDRKSFPEELISIQSAHSYAYSLGIVVQYVLGDIDFLKKDLENQYSQLQSNAAKQKKGTMLPLKHGIIKICKKINSTKYDDFLEAFTHDEHSVDPDTKLIMDLYGTRRDPINIRELHIEKGRFKYTKCNGDKKSVPVKRLKDILREVRKEGHISQEIFQ